MKCTEPLYSTPKLSYVLGHYTRVLCPCWQCLNRETEPLGKVEDHPLLYGMASTYDRWIHHGEPLHAEHGPEAHHAEHGLEA
jgi:hypothetical protein